MTSTEGSTLLQKFQKIRCVLMDVDGVLTDNTLMIMENGDLLRTMSARDGFAIRQCVNNGIAIGVITGGYSVGVNIRMKNLGSKYIYSGIKDKWATLQEILDFKEFQLDEILFIGDDVPDIPVLQKVGLSACPVDSIQEVLSMVDYVSPFQGGRGAVRDILEKLLKVKDLWTLEHGSVTG
ncbi:MAG: HAD hydrolase family protein [Saprospiraceae bacterium]|nr:HAD hydrolase family protein [Saprospiraceae bacterium]